MTDPKIRVEHTDIEAVAAGLLRGAVYTTEFLHARYRRNMQAQGRPVADIKGFGKALAGQAWQSRRIRKSHGPRVSRTQTEQRGWVYPGGTRQDDEISVAVRTMGEGYHPTHKIYQRYLEYCDREGFVAVSEQAFHRALTERGFAHRRIERVDHRYVYDTPATRANEIIGLGPWPGSRRPVEDTQVDITSDPTMHG